MFFSSFKRNIKTILYIIANSILHDFQYSRQVSQLFSLLLFIIHFLSIFQYLLQVSQLSSSFFFSSSYSLPFYISIFTSRPLSDKNPIWYTHYTCILGSSIRDHYPETIIQSCVKDCVFILELCSLFLSFTI